MRRILLVDCDQFFVQCARIADPEGAGREKLLLVGGSAEGRGVVTSASYETRAFGVRSGMPTSQALRLCPKARTVPVPRGLCSEKSRAIREVLERFTPQVEPASIDEAYLDLTGTERLYRDEPLHRTAERIQAAVLEQTNIHVSIGGGANRLVAKLAVSRAKPAGVHIVEPGGEAAFLAGHAIGDIPGVGPVLTKELLRYGLEQVTDALHLTEKQLTAMLGERRGLWLHRRMRGQDDTSVETQHAARSMSRDETFAHDISDDTELKRRLRILSRRLAADVRADGLRARTITVRIRDADFRTRQAAHTVTDAIETDAAVHAVALPLLARLRAERRIPARLLGIAASNLGGATTGAAAQTALFDAEESSLETERDRRLTRATDHVRRKYGRDALAPGDMIEPES
ncbi:MAG TPA: DNA polymerase IV [Longimicrobiales bacterium]|nr:DNA polymerase IV [Longimicrobiales bacterium]